jgi:hypothetical protein
MTWVIQLGLTIESFLNIFGASVFVVYPEWCLSYVISPSPVNTMTGTTPVPASSSTLFQVYGLLVLSETLLLLLCIPESPGIRRTRVMVFQTLGLGEAFLIGLLIWKSFDAQNSGFTASGLIIAAINLLPAFGWRIWALYIMPDLLGEQEEVTRGKKTK